MQKLTHEEFVSRIEELYNSKYKVLETYVNNTTKIDVLCPEHGVWKCSPIHFLKGHKCKKCAGNHKYTTEEFVEKVKTIHGDKFDFSLVQYETSHTKVKVICSIHGIFEIEPNALLNGCGCGKCNGKHKTTEDIIKEFREIHGDAFDYSLVDYKDSNTPVEIICNSCGYRFSQRPSKHLRIPKGRCLKCKRNPRILTDEEIINDLNIIHNNKYSYPNFKYSKTTDNILVMCPEHGEFEITYGSHKSGAGCQKCAKVYSYTTEEFIEKVSYVHDFKYDYSQFVYVNGKTKSTIICPKHGPWQQKPSDHMQGYGCPVCCSSKGELRIKKFLEKNSINFEPQYTFDDCRNINKLPFDFGVLDEDGNLICLLEFQGEQHYRAVRFSKMSDEQMIKKFNDTVFRDAIKKEYCEKNQIPILYISYKDLDKVEEILSEYLKLNFH